MISLHRFPHPIVMYFWSYFLVNPTDSTYFIVPIMFICKSYQSQYLCPTVYAIKAILASKLNQKCVLEKLSLP